jgi:hypothetical protein
MAAQPVASRVLNSIESVGWSNLTMLYLTKLEQRRIGTYRKYVVGTRIALLLCSLRDK